MIAYYYKSYSDTHFDFYNFILKENDSELLTLSGLPLEVNHTQDDIINKTNVICSQFDGYTLENIYIDNADTTFNWVW
jgi:hypothetical protein